MFTISVIDLINMQMKTLIHSSVHTFAAWNSVQPSITFTVYSDIVLTVSSVKSTDKGTGEERKCCNSSDVVSGTRRLKSNESAATSSSF